MRRWPVLFRACTLILSILLLSSNTYGQREAAGSPEKPTSLNVGYSIAAFVDMNTRDAHALTEVLVELLVRKTGLDLTSEVFMFYDLSSMDEAVRAAKLDVIILLALEYLEIGDHLTLDPSFVPVMGGEVFDEFLLLVRRDDRMKQLADLEKRKLMAGGSAGSSVPLLWLDTMLMKEGLPPGKEFFSSIHEAKKAAQAVLPVFFGQADACVVLRRDFETMVELNPQVGETLVIQRVSPGFLRGLICIRKGYGYRDLAKRSFAELHSDPSGRQLLALFRVDKLIPFDPSYLESVRGLFREYRALRKGRRER